MYDRDGLAAFERRAPSSQDVNVDDIFEQMFGRGFGSFAEEELHSQPRTRKGPSSVQKYPVTLAELYSGKSTKFAVTKNVVCSHCRGSGGRSKATPKQCRTCNGAGKCYVASLRAALTRDRSQERIATSRRRPHDSCASTVRNVCWKRHIVRRKGQVQKVQG